MNPMLTINLLDWREARREQRKKNFFTALIGAAIVSAGVVYAIMFGYNSAIGNQQDRNNYLKQQINAVNKQIAEIKDLQKTRDALITRMRIIEQLQQSRAGIVHYFDQIVATLPDGVYLTSLQQKGKTTTLNGVAESNGRVSSYMVNLDDSPYFADPRLIVIKSSNRNHRRYAQFTLTVKSETPKKDKDNKTGGSGADKS